MGSRPGPARVPQATRIEHLGLRLPLRADDLLSNSLRFLRGRSHQPGSSPRRDDAASDGGLGKPTDRRTLPLGIGSHHAFSSTIVMGATVRSLTAKRTAGRSSGSWSLAVCITSIIWRHATSHNVFAPHKGFRSMSVFEDVKNLAARSSLIGSRRAIHSMSRHKAYPRKPQAARLHARP